MWGSLTTINAFFKKIVQFGSKAGWAMGSCEHTFNKRLLLFYISLRSGLWKMITKEIQITVKAMYVDLDLLKGKMYNYYKGNLCNRKEIMLLGDLLLTFGITTTSPPGALAYNPRRKRNDEVQGFLALLWAPLVLCWRLYRKSMIMFQLRLFVSFCIMERLSEIFNNTDNFYKLK